MALLRWWARIAVFLFGLSASHGATAQLVELHGGTSSIFQAQGGTLTVQGGAYRADLSAGVVAGRAVAGVQGLYRYKHTDLVLGTDLVRLDLPTDLFQSDHRLMGVGVGVRTKTGEASRYEAGTRYEVFAGATSKRFDTPLFEGIRAEKPAGAFVMEKQLSPHLRLSTQTVYASGLSTIESLQWSPKPELKLAASGGRGNGSRYEAASVDLVRPQFDVKASYIDVGPNFQRTGSQVDLSPEPVRENVLFNWRSHGDARLVISGGRQHFVVAVDALAENGTETLPDAPSATQGISTLDHVSGAVRLARTGFTASLLHSTYNGSGNVSFAVATSRALSRELRMQATYLESHPKGPGTATVNRTLVGNVQDALTSRISANVSGTLSNGQTSVSFGGSLLSNRGTISADYETFYIPTRPGNPFEQALVLDVQLNLFGKMTAHGATFVSPTGKLLYTADMHAAQGIDGAVAPTVEHASLAECIVKGRVVDRTGLPVEGAALEVDGKMVFTDSDGRFFLRDKKPTLHLYSILTDKFLDGNVWHVISRPLRLESTRETRPDVVVIVGRGEGGGLTPRRPEGDGLMKPGVEEPTKPDPVVRAPAVEETTPGLPAQEPPRVRPVDEPPSFPQVVPPPLRAAERHAWRAIRRGVVLVAEHVWIVVLHGVAS